MSLLHRIIFVLILVCNAMSCDVCSILSCPVADLSNDNTTTNDSFSSASGDHHPNASGNYMLELSAGLYVPGDRMTVKLLLTRCIEYDQNVMIGPSWYKIEVVYEQTGLQAPGEFSKLDALSEASICRQNTIVFKACRPSVLDLPAKYHWTPSQDSRGPICFKATVHHNLANSCETITTCIPGNQDSNPVTTSPPATLKIVYGTLPTEPSPDRVKHCTEKWHCNTARLRDFCGDNGVTYRSRCHMRRDECIYGIDIKITRGQCTSVVTPSSTVVTASPTVFIASPTVQTVSPTPVPHCEILRKDLERINTSKDDWLPQCSCTGQMKPVQCWRHDGILECWCSSKIGAELYGTRRTITSCHSPTVYDLNCF